MPFSLKRIIPFLLFLVWAPSLKAQTYDPSRYQSTIFPSSTTLSDVNYGSAPQWVWPYWEVDLNCDIYLPDGDDNDNRPLIIFAHAGGFLNGSKTVDNMVAICDSFARKGFVTASLDYRKGFNPLDGESAERAVYRGIQDGKAAVRFFKENADLYHIDTNAIFFGGMSAGGFISLYVGSMDKESERPASTYGGFTVNDLECLDCAGNDFPHSSEVRGVLDYWGGIDDTLFIEPGDPPILIMHGENDPTVPFIYDHPFGLFTLPETYGGQPIMERSMNLDRQVKHFTSEGSLHMLDGSNNGTFDDPPNSFWSDTLLPETMIFLRDILQPTPDKLSPDSQITCIDDMLTFTVTDSASSYYIWEYNTSEITEVYDMNDNYIELEFPNAGDYVISVIEYDQLLYPSDTLSFFVQVAPLLTVDFDYSQDLNNFDFTNLTSGGVSYEWSFGDGGSSSLENPSYSYSSDGTYTVNLIVTDEFGCEYEFSETVIVAGLTLDELGHDMQLYPNPFSDFLILNSSNFNSVQIYNSTGVLVYSSTESDKAEIETGNWSAGLYNVVFTNQAGNTISKRIIKAE